jgi:WD40 repeat protein/tRNA A-37 threonylcarbamoyl transferase component Bud32
VTVDIPINPGEGDQGIADQIADLAERVARGENPVVDRSENLNAGASETLQRLLPTIRLLSELAGEEATDVRPAWFARPPDVLGDFQLGREIGRGGIGVVYEARQISLGRRVAVKVLPPASLLDHRQLRRFEIEAQAAASLQHPNIVPVFAYGSERGVPYFAMRLIDGRNLAEVVGELRDRRGYGLPPREVAELGRQAAEALDYAHRNEVLHRDIKPSNFLIDADHRLWIADFGLARIRNDSDLTASGDIIGTLRYLSPEQAKGRHAAVDGRSDVYGLGATLYELLTLRQVFAGVDRAEILIRIVSDEPRFSRELDAAIPLDLRTIVLKALAKDPADRYATAGDLATDLTLFLANQPIRARPAALVPRGIKWARRHWRGMAAAGLLIGLMLVGVAAAALWSNSRLRAVNERLESEIDRADRNARQARIHAETSERHALAAQLRLAAQALEAAQPERAQEILREIPPDAGSEASRSFVWRYLWRQARREIVVLVGPMPRFMGMALSPDGKLLATNADTAGLQIRDAASGSWIRDTDRVTGKIEGPIFSPDGSLVAAGEQSIDNSSPDGFSIWEVASGRRLVRLPMRRGHQFLGCSFLREGRFLGFGDPSLTRLWNLADGPSHPRLVDEFEGCPGLYSASAGAAILNRETSRKFSLRDVHTGTPTREFQVLPSSESIVACVCSPDAEVVVAVTAPSWELKLWDGQTGKLRATHAVPPNVYRLYLSPDNATLAAIDQRESVHLVQCRSGAIRRLGYEQAAQPRATAIAFSPDSTRLATIVFGIAKGRDPDPVSIWDTATGRRLATFPGRSEVLWNLIFTPDGRSLLISSQSGVRRWQLAPENDDRDRQPAGHKDEAWSLVFSPDGRTLATGSDDSEPDQTIKLWDAATGRLKRAWHGEAGTVAALAFSPDGRTLASGHLESANNVRIWDVPTGRRLATLKGHTDRVRAVAFARDGLCLASAGSDGTVRLWDVASWHERTVLRGHADTVHAVAFSADGATLASAGNDGDVRPWDLRSGDGATSQPRVLHNRASLMAIAFAPDGKTLAVADTIGSMTIWDLNLRAPIRVIHGDGDELRQLAFTPDGSALAAAGKKGLIRLWDPATGQELLSVAAHRAQINGLAFSPDGSTLGSVAHDGSVRLWHTEP